MSSASENVPTNLVRYSTLAQLGRKARCARSTIQLWLEQFRNGGLKSLLDRRSPPGQTSPLSHPNVLSKLQDGLRNGRWRTYNEVAAWLNALHDIRMTPKSLQRRLRAMGLGLRKPKPASIKSPPASRTRRNERRGEHQTDHAIVSYDLGVGAALNSIRAMERSQAGGQTGDLSGVAPIDVYLEVIFELLEKGECSLAQANRFVVAARQKWERERQSG
jgi:transposase